MVERRDLPLFAWGDALRTARATRRRVVRRSVFVGLGCACLAATVAAPPLPRLVWNASASAPLGLYRVAPGERVRRGDMVIARTPIAVRGLAAGRRYIPANVPLVKRAAGVPGDTICAVGTTISINGRPVAIRRTNDARGRRLPWWSGCRTLRDGAVFLLMGKILDSFDGRYFGPTAADDLIGKATAIWVR